MAELSQPGAGLSLELAGLQRLLGFHLRMAHGAMYRDFAAAMSEVALTQKQYAALHLIAANPGASQVDVAAVLGTDRATMMAVVDRLENRRLVKRRRSKTDRRRQDLSVTSEGEALLAKANAIVAAHEDRFLSRLSASEAKALFATLTRLHAGAIGRRGED